MTLRSRKPSQAATARSHGFAFDEARIMITGLFLTIAAAIAGLGAAFALQMV